MKITVIGTGYVGLTTGACLASVGHDVVCMDIDEEKITGLQKGILPIIEPGLEEIVRKALDNHTISFTADLSEAVMHADIVFSAVGTPEHADGSVDLQYVYTVAQSFGEHIAKEMIFVNKSTVPIGTSEICKTIIREEMEKRGVNYSFMMVSNPEFLQEGKAVENTLNPDRIVIGVENDTAFGTMQEVYKPLIGDRNIPILKMDVKSAEITKYASNAFLATKISFINEIAQFCAIAGGNVNEVANAMSFDKRIGAVKPGIGYGGGCFPKDVHALLHTGSEHAFDFSIINAADRVNSIQRVALYTMVKKEFGDISEKKICLWGLAFKPETNDLRESQSLELAALFHKDGAIVHAYDPAFTQKDQSLFPNITVYDNAIDAVEGADVLCIVTEWNEFITVDMHLVKEKMKTPVLCDGRNIYDQQKMHVLGFTYLHI